MKEASRTSKQNMAFEKFVFRGAVASKKSFEQIGYEVGVTARTLWNWYKRYNWRERAAQITIQAEKHPYNPPPTVDSIVEDALRTAHEEKNRVVAEYNERVREHCDQVIRVALAGVATAFERDEDGTVRLAFTVKKASDLKALADAIATMHKLGLLTLGEETEREEYTVSVKLPENLPPGFWDDDDVPIKGDE